MTTGAVLVVGDVMLDRYLIGEVSRVSPEAPVPVLRHERTEVRAGGAANVALNIAAMGGSVSLLAVRAGDAEAAELAGLLDAQGLVWHSLSDANAITTTKTRMMARQQQMLRLDRETPLDGHTAGRLMQAARERLSAFSLLLLSDYDKGAINNAAVLIAEARAAGLTVLVDPKKADFSAYRGASLISPNVSEFIAAGGDMRSHRSMLASARALLCEHDIDAMVLTRNVDGMTLISAEIEHHVAAEALEVSDVTGAGDTVIAALAASLAEGTSLTEAVARANLAAGIAVSRSGTAVVSRADLGLAAPASPAILDRPALLAERQRLRQAGKRVVLTNGCFDLLHAGHVRYLAQARALGDVLVVALNSDASVTRLKGSTRPVNCWSARAAVLAALTSVDYVVPFGDDPAEQDSPAQLIAALAPDVLVKGGDYRPQDLAGASAVRAGGGSVRVLPYFAGHSSSQLIRRLRGEQ